MSTNSASRKVHEGVRITMTSVDVDGGSEKNSSNVVPKDKLENWNEQWKQSIA